MPALGHLRQLGRRDGVAPALLVRPRRRPGGRTCAPPTARCARARGRDRAAAGPTARAAAGGSWRRGRPGARAATVPPAPRGAARRARPCRASAAGRVAARGRWQRDCRAAPRLGGAPRPHAGRMRRALLLTILIGALAAPAASAQAQAPAPAEPRIRAAVLVAGVDIGGLTVAEARLRLKDALGPAYREPVVIQAAGKSFKLARRTIRFRFDARATARQALAAGAAMPPAADGSVAPVAVTPVVRYRRDPIGAWIRSVKTRVTVAPRDATIAYSIRRMKRRHSRPGRTLRTAGIKAAVERAFADPAASRVLAPGRRYVPAKVGWSDLRRVYGTVLTIEQRTFKLRLFKRLRLAKTYRVAVGQPAYPTPSGVFAITSKQVNPVWTAPNSPWAGELAGTSRRRRGGQQPAEGALDGAGGRRRDPRHRAALVHRHAGLARLHPHDASRTSSSCSAASRWARRSSSADACGRAARPSATMSRRASLHGRSRHGLLVGHRRGHRRSPGHARGGPSTPPRAARDARRARGEGLPDARPRRHRRGLHAGRGGRGGGRRGRRGRARQQRRLQPVGRRGVGHHGRRPAPVRDQRARPAPHVPARPARHAGAAPGPHRQRLLDGRPADLPRRRRSTTRASTRSRRCRTRCATRSGRFGVEVVIVQPGLIRTRLRRRGHRRHRLRHLRRRAVRRFNRAVAEATEQVVRARAAGRLGGSPDAVAERIEAILRDPKPRARYPVTASARVMLLARRVLPDAAWDA